MFLPVRYKEAPGGWMRDVRLRVLVHILGHYIFCPAATTVQCVVTYSHQGFSNIICPNGSLRDCVRALRSCSYIRISEDVVRRAERRTEL
jgi:hypothetical protein